MIDWDIFNVECESFTRDVHILILGTLHASISYLDTEVEQESAQLKQHLESKHAQRAAEELAETWAILGDQQRFVRNMALVALLSRLTHAINEMIGFADIYTPKNPDGYPGKNEFRRLWRELSERFGIELGAKEITFVEPLRRARNLIVHSGGAANPRIPFDQIDADAPFDEFYDQSFSSKYPKLVTGSGHTAEVEISEADLNRAIESAISLVNVIGSKLRQHQMNSIKH